ncbi:protein STPG3 isoform X2 [Erythrolamprus reginae]|uniref:protein STPG3 isoform X2 n=1 Tax=Erythrolamprus reginae TaxID=121349 RepID=UPI00396CC210
MDAQKTHVKFMAQKYLDSSQRRTPQALSPIYKRGHQGTETKGTPLFPDIYSGKKNIKRKPSEEKTPSRLQYVLNTDTPGPAAYSPPALGFRETIAPSYTFGRKTPPREGGGRRAWQKSWFMSKNPFWRKVDFSTESNWPSPSQYGQLLGPKLGNPNFTFGQRGEYCLINKGMLDEPGPTQYNIDRAYTFVLQRSPSIIINPAPLKLYKWIKKETTPGPGAYNVDKGHNARLPRCPSFYIQGVRRPKKHETGPFSTL